MADRPQIGSIPPTPPQFPPPHNLPTPSNSGGAPPAFLAASRASISLPGHPHGINSQISSPPTLSSHPPPFAIQTATPKSSICHVNPPPTPSDNAVVRLQATPPPPPPSVYNSTRRSSTAPPPLPSFHQPGTPVNQTTAYEDDYVIPDDTPNVSMFNAHLTAGNSSFQEQTRNRSHAQTGPSSRFPDPSTTMGPHYHRTPHSLGTAERPVAPPAPKPPITPSLSASSFPLAPAAPKPPVNPSISTTSPVAPVAPSLPTPVSQSTVSIHLNSSYPNGRPASISTPPLPPNHPSIVATAPLTTTSASLHRKGNAVDPLIEADTEFDEDAVLDSIDAQLVSMQVASTLNVISLNVLISQMSKFVTSRQFVYFLQHYPGNSKALQLKQGYDELQAVLSQKLKDLSLYINQLLRSFLSLPKSQVDYDALKMALDESRLLDQSSLDHSTIHNAEILLRSLKNSRQALKALQSATKSRDLDVLDEALINARIMDVDQSHPDYIAAEREYTKLSKKGQVEDSLSLGDLHSLQTCSSIYVPLLSVLPLNMDLSLHHLHTNMHVLLSNSNGSQQKAGPAPQKSAIESTKATISSLLSTLSQHLHLDSSSSSSSGTASSSQQTISAPTPTLPPHSTAAASGTTDNLRNSASLSSSASSSSLTAAPTPSSSTATAATPAIAHNSFLPQVDLSIQSTPILPQIGATQLAPSVKWDKLHGIDLRFEGLLSMPNLEHFVDTFVQIPSILYDCVQFIRFSQGWLEEGVYRISGPSQQIQDMLHQFNRQHLRCVKEGGFDSSAWQMLHPWYHDIRYGLPHDDTTQTSPDQYRVTLAPIAYTEVRPSIFAPQIKNVHCATNVLKRFLRLLKDPIIPYHDYGDWIQVASLADPLSTVIMTPLPVSDLPQGSKDVQPSRFAQEMKERFQKSTRLQRLYVLIHNLPLFNLNILRYLLLSMYFISLNHQQNKMVPYNLAIVVAPNLLRLAEENNVTAMDAQQQLAMANNSKTANDIISLCIQYAPLLFFKPKKS